MDEVRILDLPNKKLSIEYLYCVEDYYTMSFMVESTGFNGQSTFCFSKDNLINIINSIELLLEKLEGSSVIRDRDSDAHLKITMKNLGQLTISGQIGGSFEDHYLKFKFDSDQTILTELRKFFKRIL